MQLNRIEVRHLRNLSSVSLQPTSGINIIEGLNASGKTSLLEAIHILGLARSFRTGKPEKLIQYGEASYTLFAELTNQTPHRLGIQRYRDQRLELRLDGSKLHSRSELATILPLQLITPESTLLLTGAPAERRNFIDWIMFHVEPTFHQVWKSYQLHLKQRNALLRQGSLETLSLWSQGLIEYGEKIDQLRRGVIDELIHFIARYCSQILPDIDIHVHYRQGWRKDLTLAESIDNALDTDRKMHFTTTGPHRAELIFKHGELNVSEVLSRGQLKLLLCVLKLAQIGFLREKTAISPVVLIDDLPAELDSSHRKLLLSHLHQLETQVFVTTTSRSLLEVSELMDVKLFHVEHGKIQEVV
ncbi:MAG: DNA replication/repair protein RecF [Pseudomonadota bacterium]